MTSWILPGRVNNPVMRYKAILETSLAFSRTFNSRNIEFPWYALWNQTLCDLVADVPNLIVTPQFPVCIAAQCKAVASKKPDDNEDEGGAGDISFASTVAEKHADSVVVDFVILNLTAQPQSGWKSRYGGWRIAAASVDLLVEVKRFASRSATGKAQEALIFEKIVEARGDLLNQAAHLFIQDSKKKSVLGIAAAGNLTIS
ncbi:hypothetical protein EDB19DRAFT_1964635 [Suillus lakei]|nr:hypothetical protein EDB19DRAFT_1964635 [Suillus lakei]